MWTVGFEAVIERQLNYSKVVLPMWDVCMHVRGLCACTVCVRATKWVLTSKVITQKEIIKL